MAFPTGWLRKCALTIDKTKVPGDQTDFPVLFNRENLPSEMLDADGSYPCIDDGNDVRFSSDSAGATPLCVDIVRCTIDNNPANAKAEIWVKIPSLSSSVNTVIYVWYGKVGESMPADNSTYGAENVWSSSFRAVYHMNNASASTIKDFTSYHNTGTKSANATTQVDGKFDGSRAQEFVQATDTNIDCGNTTASDIPNTFTMSSWLYLDDTNYGSVWGKGQAGYGGQDYTIQTKGNGFRLTVNDSQSDEGSTISTGTWYLVHFTYDGTNKRNYINAGAPSTFAQTAASINDTAGSKINLGRCHADQNYDGKMDEVRLAAATRSANWITTEYNSQSSPSTFASAGTPQSTTTYQPGLMAFFQ